MEKLVSRSLMLILIGMATAQNIQAGERMSMPTSFKKQTTGLSHVSQQTISVKGNVRDQSGEPMAGVNVIVEGTTIGTMTDSNGNFTLNVPSTSIKIKFSYIGYEDQIVLIKNNRNLNITLNENSEMLDEVQIIGYGTQKKITVTGAVSSVGTKDILKSPVPNIAQALTGKVPGLSTIQYSGQPGADDPAIFVRGIGSLDAKRAAPLVMVDGVERSFFRLDPNEIENITVLKDASATAVFGVRGANGVILVTTKRGEEGKAQISVSTSASLQKPIRLYEYANSYDYAVAFNEKLTNDGASPVFGEKILDAFKNHTDPLLYPDMDWMELILKPTSFQSQHNLSISGGTDRVRYFTSVGILTQDGLFRSFDAGYNSNFTYNRYNYRANLDIDVTRSTLLKINLGGRLEDTKEPNTKSNLFTFLTRVTPFGGAGLYDGKWIHTSPDNIGWDKGALENADPFECFFGKGYNQRIYNEINLDLSLQQKLDFLTKGLSLNIKGSYNSGYTHRKNRYKEIPYYTAHRDPETNELFFRKFREESQLYFEESTDRGRNWYLEGSLNYDRKFGKHQVGALILYNQWRDQYPDPAQFDYVSIPRGYVGLVGRATYNFDNRYMVDFNVGYNGSENFAPGHRYGIFPAFSAGWILSEEKFMKNQSFINYLKIRGSYGIVGNDLMNTKSRFFYLPDAYNPYGTSYNFGVDVSGNRDGATELQMGNPLVSWEKAGKQNYGLDFSILDEHLSGSFDYFIEKRHDILTTRNTAPNFIAITMPVVNIGKVDNKGFELVLKWNHSIGDFKYWINGNLSYAKNKIVYKDEIPHKYPWLYETGQSVGQPFGFIFDGFVTEADLESGKLPDHKLDLKPGDAKYKDLNGDGKIDDYDHCHQQYSTLPEIYYGFSLGADYRNWGIKAHFQGVAHRSVSTMLASIYHPLYGNDKNVSEHYLENRWTDATPDARYPRLTTLSNNHNFQTSSLWMEKGDYLKLRVLELSYKLPARFAEKMRMSDCRLFLKGMNLFSIDHVGIMDPEQMDMEYPSSRSYLIGINVLF